MSTKKKLPYSEAEYLILKNAKSCLREHEKVVAFIPTQTPCTRFNESGERTNYSIICTQHRIIIYAKSQTHEFSTSFGYQELPRLTIIKGIFKDKVRIHREIFTISKKGAARLSTVSDFINVKLSIWKYPVLIISLFLLFALGYKGYLAVSDFIVFGSFQPEPQNTTRQPNTQAPPQNTTAVQTDTEKVLKNVLEGYEYVFKQILKNYNIYINKPALSGDPSSNFDQWAMTEVINTLDSQDSKISSLNIVLERHVMVKLGISELRMEVMKYLDLCKKSFSDKREKQRLGKIREKIEKKISELQQILT